MKSVRCLLLAFLLVGAAACQKETVVPSATDPLPFLLDGNKDLSTQPGDDFWQYCNGAWDAKTPVPATDAVGGMYDMKGVMDQMVAATISEDPSLKRFFQLSDELYANSDAADAFLQGLAAKYATPQTREACLKLIGQMIMDGITPISLTLLNDYKDGKMIGLFSVYGSLYKYSFAEMPEAVKPDLRLIVEGMGLDPEILYYNDATVYVLSTITSLSLESLQTAIPKGLASLYPYASEALNASLGSGAMTPDQVRNWARMYLSYLISNRLAVKYISPELKQRYQELIERLRDAFQNRIRQLAWMSETTRANALEKLDKLMPFVGCPDIWYQDCLPDLSQCKSLVEAVYTLMGCRTRVFKHLIGTGDAFTNSIVSGARTADGWVITDLTFVNSYYKREYNCIVILPAFILPPVMRDDVSEATQYGGLFTIAHEITHGFDSEGARYDAMGRKHNWWTVADQMAFEDEQQKLVKCYSTLEYDPLGHPGQYTDGKRTLAENIADLGGFLILRDAYVKRLQEQGFTGEAYSAQLRKLYESVADLSRAKYSEAKLADIVTTDVHSHCRLRVNGVVMNTDMWYDLYDVTRDNILYLPPERRTYIW